MALLPSSAVFMVSTHALLAWACLLAAVAAATSSSPAKETYIVHMDSDKVLALNLSLNGILDTLSFSTQEQSPIELLYLYETAIFGFAAKLSTEQVKYLQTLDGFLAAYPDDITINLHTTHSPQFLGLTPGKGLWAPSNLASDVIVGVVDTGIWPEHASFAGTGAIHGRIPRGWKGACESGTMFSPKNCNNKLIGARAFWKGYEAIGGKINETTDYRSARDSQGHGTHTASTAAGNIITGASLFGNAKGPASGMMYTARVAAYKACWSSGCASSDILAAIDSAIVDGVHVLSLSLGGTSRPYYYDPIAIASFSAIQRGIFVSCSAGNSGPSESTVSNMAPWIMTVAASYIDRSFPTTIKLGDGRTFTGASLYSGHPTKQLPLVFIDNEDARYCGQGSLTEKLVRGKIVVCERGGNSRTEKGEQVKLAGGAGMLLANSESQGEELFADAHVLPASSLSGAAYAAVKSYILSSSNPTTSIAFHGTTYGTSAPVMAAFSSRGPSSVGDDVIKPDVTAPGMSILAAWPPTPSPSLLDSDKRSVGFNIISGTSMSCPHVSGVASLLKSTHPSWSPAALKSALMTTSYTHNNMNGSIIDVSTGLDANPFAFGSGHIEPQMAANPGLVYDILVSDWFNYLCGLNYTATQVSIVARKGYKCKKSGGFELNYPSFSVVFGTGGKEKIVQRRTVTNVKPGQCKYVVSVTEPKGVVVMVEPKVLGFGRIGQKLSYEVSFEGGGGSGYSFGEIVWVCGEFRVRSPIAVESFFSRIK